MEIPAQKAVYDRQIPYPGDRTILPAHGDKCGHITRLDDATRCRAIVGNGQAANELQLTGGALRN